MCDNNFKKQWQSVNVKIKNAKDKKINIEYITVDNKKI